MAQVRLRKNSAVTFEEFTHTYTTSEGKFLMGVTTLMKKHGLSPDYSGISEEVLAKAAERGTRIHHMLEDYDNGKVVAEDAEGNLKAYRELGLQVIKSEYLVSDNELVASSIDKVLADCSLADVKTTSSVHKDAVAWQLSIYAYLFEKQNPSHKVPAIYCIHVRDGKAKLIELNRVSDERVEALLEAERNGVIYHDEKEVTDVTEVMTDGDALELVDALNIIAQYKAMLKAEEERAKALTDKLYDYMVENNLDEMSCANGKFIRRASTTRTTLDSAKVKNLHPDVYDECLKTSEVKGSISFKENK